MKKILFPTVCMIVAIAGAICDFAGALNEKSLDEKIDEAVTKKLEERDSE